MTRRERLEDAIATHLSGLDFSEYEEAEGIRDEIPRYAMIDSCTYAWINFGESIEDLTYYSEGFEPVMLVDLDTGDCYWPKLSWRKADT